ncbi:hypothetical protein GUITHDRAFT_150060 [Guillardia theta CCMP2712]|uniref:Uncharacterized protein n=1 Tax=Guillardia theta (strain CCMP2712) TaxID=905079 RepID=L1K187_GUITC|nr:hypothetical protein GUITHDRAFT_150060 [Guillardia theta CCMP2712]EKX54616.1 hypothetical protein GUITHDRAFT_150060 [Guillardia theta CCMP2712]|eukprot:XP_005841596.1 hypothetical protein GUITHDRAFT_150060 [Guillardia theta CCMP2712]
MITFSIFSGGSLFFFIFAWYLRRRFFRLSDAESFEWDVSVHGTVSKTVANR